MKTLKLIPVFLLLATLAGCSSKPEGPPLETIKTLDVKRYSGLWYEAARLPNRFQKKCESSTAEYTLRDDGKITVKNVCYKAGYRDEITSIEGTAAVADPAEPAKLWVRFFWPFKGAYWVIYLDEDYQWAVVGEAGRNYLWVLTRKADHDQAELERIVKMLPRWGYDPSDLVYAKR